MRKSIAITLLTGGLFAITTIGCGESYTPLTDEQVQQQAEEKFKAEESAIRADAEASCQANFDAAVNARVEALKAGA